MYHQNKFGRQEINSSENVAESHILITRALAVTLTLKIATTKNTTFPHVTLASDAASPYQIW